MSRISSRRAAVVIAVLGAAIVGAAPAQATHYQDMLQVNVYAPPRVYEYTNTLPIEEFERTRPPTRHVVGGHTHRVFWNNSVAGGSSTTEALAQMRRTTRPTGVFADRRLSAAERTRFREVAALYDDADVMVLAASHPACKGITRAQARAIVAGKIRRWSQIVSGAAKDAISVRYRGTAAQADLRFGARYVRRANGRYGVSYPAGSRGSADGGMRAAALGDHSVAAVTAWSRVRGAQPGVCAVPLGGVAPTNATVIDHSYPEAFRVTYVVPRRPVAGALERWGATLLQDFLKSAKAKAVLARRGLLVVGGAPAGAGGVPTASVVAPSTDHAGRAITTRADATGEASLVGLRLDSAATAEGSHRLVFDPQGALRRLVFDVSGACIAEQGGGWTVKGAWRYAEHGGGLVARLGWFLGDPLNERIIDLPAAEPATAYLDGVAYAIAPAAVSTCATV